MVLSFPIATTLLRQGTVRADLRDDLHLASLQPSQPVELCHTSVASHEMWPLLLRWSSCKRKRCQAGRICLTANMHEPEAKQTNTTQAYR
jgi:hypothetical protein